jgi:hypothetical protein
MRAIPGVMLFTTLALFAFKLGRFVPIVIVIGCVLDEVV